MDQQAILAMCRAKTSGSSIATGVLEDRATAFSLIYQRRLWGTGESASGPGSSVANAQGAARAVAEVVRSNGVKSLIDVGCGDLNWLGPELASFPLLHVTAIDIAAAAYASASADPRYAAVAFRAHDVVASPLPVAAELLLCRQCLNHMSAEDAVRALRHIAQSGARLLLLSHYARGDNSAEMLTVGVKYRSWNLQQPPFSDLLPPPEKCFEDEYNVNEEQRPMVLALYRLGLQ